MADTDPNAANSMPQRQRALSTWDTEGGAGPCGPQTEPDVKEAPRQGLDPAAAEVVQLRIRVIALENLVIALLAGVPERQLMHARGMSAHMSARPGSTRDPMTLHAAKQMIDLVDRARLARGADIDAR